MIFLRSLAFAIAFYGWTAILSLGCIWVLFLPRAVLVRVITWYLDTVTFLERTLLGLTYEVRGLEHRPQGAYIVAAKHQSAWETMKLHRLFGDPAVVLKRELTRIPLWCYYATKAEMIAIDRDGMTKAMVALIADARRAAAAGRPIVIFPQGTRTAPGSTAPYHGGVGLLYTSLGLPILPVALNAGMFWPRRRFIKRPGTITVELLPLIMPGLTRKQVMAELEDRLEAATDRLVTAVGGPAARPDKVATAPRSAADAHGENTPACG
ncbi:MAG: lysophospholipid acyltransferase family protein [Azospirillaceae bacterium]|nr:lysophospholipid acyltransferase family protein [Azospirillaceae bacterium]